MANTSNSYYNVKVNAKFLVIALTLTPHSSFVGTIKRYHFGGIHASDDVFACKIFQIPKPRKTHYACALIECGLPELF